MAVNDLPVMALMKRGSEALSKNNANPFVGTQYWFKARLRSMAAMVVVIALTIVSVGVLPRLQDGTSLGWPNGLLFLVAGLPLLILLILLRTSSRQATHDWASEIDISRTQVRRRTTKTTRGFPVAMPGPASRDGEAGTGKAETASGRTENTGL